MATPRPTPGGPPLRRGPAIGLAAILGGSGLLLVGWTGLLVPSLIRSIEADFAQTDAAIGVFFFVNAAASVGLAILLAVARVPSGRHTFHVQTDTPASRPWVSLPLLALAVAIACYVGAEIGVSDWLVRFLASASLGLATAALALFWGCLA